MGAEQGVHYDVQEVVDHPGQEVSQEGVGLLQAWVRVALDQDSVQVLVKDKVIAKQLECVLLHE